MVIKTMSATEDTTAQHKRNASATSAVQTSPPPAKRPEPASTTATPFVVGRRDFPHAVALVLYKDGADDTSSTTVLGVYASLTDANDEVRRLGHEQGAIKDEPTTAAAVANSSEPARWEAADGVSCWAELHAVKPKTIVRRDVSSAFSSEPPKKLYDAEEGEDPDLDDDDQEEGGHYD
ncbi:actin polymerization protein [Colletotrichum plurivorum]|uniref:Actin polymerization protein n=1 Tax=Colletotrichum plurivorum TaxID=2175906 RepID=A0A8H6KYV8_9PEZI|nr:actin polymerization protein [Colletotrichum plurivorum]